jgi:hypothetical protein
MIRARRLGASAADIGEVLGITRQAVDNRLHALEQRTPTDPDFAIPDLEEPKRSRISTPRPPRSSNGASHAI